MKDTFDILRASNLGRLPDLGPDDDIFDSLVDLHLEGEGPTTSVALIDWWGDEDGDGRGAQVVH